MLKSKVETSDNYIYYNATLYNNTSDSIPMRINDTRSSTILDDPSKYSLAVAVANIPVMEIPILNFLDNTYKLSLVYGGTTYQKVLTMTSGAIDEPDYRGVFAYGEMIDSINNGFTAAYADLVAANPGVTSIGATVAPFLSYDETNGLFTIKTPLSGYDTTKAGTVEIWMNQPLFRMFPTFRILYKKYGSANGLDVRVYIFDDGDNTVAGTCYMRQYATSTGAWNDASSIVLTTNTLPVVGEYISIKSNNVNSFQDSSLKILMDLQFPVQSGIQDVTPNSILSLIYTPSLYRLIDMTSSQAISKIDLQVYWKDKRNILREHVLSPGEQVVIKLVFVRKLTN